MAVNEKHHGRIPIGFFAQIGTIALFLVGLSCTPTLDAGGGEQAMQEFHRAINTRDAKTIFEMMAPELRASTDLAAVSAVVGMINERLGDHQDSDQIRAMIMKSTSGNYIALTYSSQYTRGRLREHFAWRLLEGRTELVRYEASSPQLPSSIKLVPKE